LSVGDSKALKIPIRGVSRLQLQLVETRYICGFSFDASIGAWGNPRVTR
jgi:hypothetical protein